jgi:precorrin-6B methylase 2
MIGRYLKDIEELFIGATGTTKEGFLAICKNCTKLKRLSVVANEITTEVVTEILLGLKDLQWLDLSYCGLGKNDREKIEKLKIFNKDLEIVFGM